MRRIVSYKLLIRKNRFISCSSSNFIKALTINEYYVNAFICKEIAYLDVIRLKEMVWLVEENNILSWLRTKDSAITFC